MTTKLTHNFFFFCCFFVFSFAYDKAYFCKINHFLSKTTIKM